MVVSIKPTETHIYDPKSGRFIHGFVLETIKKVKKELADKLHDEHGVKPFTVSPIQGPFGKASTNRLVIKDFVYWIRFTFLTEETFKVFSSAIFPMTVDNAEIVLGEGKYKILKTHLEGDGTKNWAKISSFTSIKKEANEKAKKLLKNSTAPYHLKFSFRTPTSFRRGKTSYLFPEPILLFSSYMKKWNSFSNTKIDRGFIEKVAPDLVVTSYRMRTETFDTGDAIFAGFKGSCMFSYLGNEIKALTTLISLGKFSFFCGTGHKTTMGMGMTRFYHEKA